MSPPPHDDARPPTQRDRLLEAGLELVDELPLPKVFAGATTAKIAAAAGVTTGSFFHHFSSHAEYVDALTMSILDVEAPVRDVSEEWAGSVVQLDLLEVLRIALRETWSTFRSDPSARQALRFEHLLWSHHDRPLGAPHDGMDTVGDVIRRSRRMRLDVAVADWDRLLEITGRTFVEPFDTRRIGIALSALFDGLLVQDQVDPGAVNDEMFADVAAILASALTVPRGSQLRLADLVEPWFEREDLSPQARSGARRRLQTRARIIEASTGLFDAGWESVRASDIAEAAGVSNQTVLNVFSSVREVAAATFVRHVPVLREVAEGSTEEDPLVALHRVLGRLIEVAAGDPEPARALLEERVARKLHRGGALAEIDLRLEVPLTQLLLSSVERLDLDGNEPIQVVALLNDTALGLAIDRDGRHGDAAALAMRLLPPSATGIQPWTPPTASQPAAPAGSRSEG